MGKVLILYDSASGNTAKIVEPVSAGAAGMRGMEWVAVFVDNIR